MTHSFKVHFFHLVWSTKNRQPFITPEIQEQLYPYIGGIVRNNQGSLLEIGGLPDHVHLLIYLTNLEKYSSMIRDVKCNSTLWVGKNFPKYKEFKWQDGYSSFTINHSILDKVRKYIQNQEKVHKNMSFEEEYVNFLKDQNVTFDDRFVLG